MIQHSHYLMHHMYLIDGDSMVAFANSDEVQSLYDSLAEKSNLRCLGMYYYGSREVTTNKYAAKTPDDLKAVS